MDIEKLTDEQLIRMHRQATRLAALIDNGIRIGVDTPKFKELDNIVNQRLTDLEVEYFKRKPEEDLNRKRQFLTFCDAAITNYNFDVFGKIQDAITQEIFVEYNKPRTGEKEITNKATLKPENEGAAPTNILSTDVQKMDGNDDLFAALEDALDEYADDLPDGPAENK